MRRTLYPCGTGVCSLPNKSIPMKPMPSDNPADASPNSVTSSRRRGCDMGMYPANPNNVVAPMQASVCPGGKIPTLMELSRGAPAVASMLLLLLLFEFNAVALFVSKDEDAGDPLLLLLLFAVGVFV